MGRRKIAGSAHGGGRRSDSKASKRVKEKAGSKEAPQLSPKGWRLWSFRIVSVTVIPGLFLLVLELSLRAVGYGYPAAATIRCKVGDTPGYCDHVKFGWRFFPRNLARESEPFVFAADKPDNTYRVFVLGGSAAKGTPDAAFCFGRFLRLMLRHEYPGVDFDVITTAMAAINSHVVLEIAKDCARHEPDLFVVYLGNNEVTGPYGVGTVFTPLSSSLALIRAGVAVKATRVGQMLTDLSELAGRERGGPDVWRGLQMFLDKQVRAGDPGLETVYQHFRKNLEDISRAGTRAGARVVLCTVGSNLKDSPPFASLHRPDITPQDKKAWGEVYQEGAAFEAAGEYAKSANCYLRAAEIDSSYADLHFRLGRCYYAVAEYDKARQSFIAARELDTLRFRVDRRINNIVRDVARQRGGQGVYFVDAVEAFENHSPHGICGEELFYEHVHLNFDGNYLLAKTVFNRIDAILPQWVKSRKTGKGSLLTPTDCAPHLAYTDWDRYKILDEIVNGFIGKPPFTNQLYHAERLAGMEQQLQSLKANLTDVVLQGSAEQYRRAIESDNADVRLHFKYGKLLAEDIKDYRAAEEQYRLVQRFWPHSYIVYEALGTVLRGAGDLASAMAHYLEAIQIKPTCTDSHYYVGWIYQKQGDIDKAAEYYSKVVQLQPDYVHAYNNLGEILYRQGKIDEAMQVCREGLRFVPNNPILHSNLGLLLSKQGNKTAAIKELQTALQLDPNSAKIRAALKSVLDRGN
ncbi:MAG: tetratricopeptide repeat protein [Phycisphaerales bacterium]|nr:MAG: tetratricopeptide repeat protein [Phycisphaerales bacterium]